MNFCDGFQGTLDEGCVMMLWADYMTLNCMNLKCVGFTTLELHDFKNMNICPECV